MFEFQPVQKTVFTALEAAVYLRLDIGKNDENSAIAAVNWLVDERKLLRPVMYARQRLYLKSELDRFLEDRME